MSAREFTTEMSIEERVINWHIRNFQETHEINKSKKAISTLEFSAGKRHNQPLIWAVQLSFPSGDYLGLHLGLKEIPDPEKGVDARVCTSVIVKHPNSEEVILSLNTAIKEVKMGKGWDWKNFATLDTLKSAGALINDTLTIQVKIIIYGADNTTPTCSQENLQQNALKQVAQHYPKEGVGSVGVSPVMTLVSQSQYFEKKVHQNILSARSSVFEALMASQKSKETGILIIEDLTPKGLDVFLQFIYSGNLPDDWKHVPDEILNAAEKYNLPLLKIYIDGCLHNICTPENAFTLLKLAKGHKLSNAFKNISEYIKSNLENVFNTV